MPNLGDYVHHYSCSDKRSLIKFIMLLPQPVSMPCRIDQQLKSLKLSIFIDFHLSLTHYSLCWLSFLSSKPKSIPMNVTVNKNKEHIGSLRKINNILRTTRLGDTKSLHTWFKVLVDHSCDDWCLSCYLCDLAIAWS